MTLGATPIRWDGPAQTRIYRPDGCTCKSGDRAFALAAEPEIDPLDGGTVWVATCRGMSGVSGNGWGQRKSIKVVCRTCNSEGLTVSECPIEIDVDNIEYDIEYDDCGGDWVEHDGNKHKLVRPEVVKGVYLATRQAE